MIRTNPDAVPAAGIDQGRGITPSPFRTKGHRRFTLFLPIEPLVVIVAEINGSFVDRVGSAAIFMDARAGVERGRCDVLDGPIGALADDDIPTFFRRPGFDPIQIGVVHDNLFQTNGAGHDQVGSKRRFPGAVGGNGWHGSLLSSGVRCVGSLRPLILRRDNHNVIHGRRRRPNAPYNSSMGELEYIHWLRQRTPADPRVLVGPGDETAVIRAPAGGSWLVTTDMLLEGSHFRFPQADPKQVGRKAMAVNLSDIAAMAGKPVAAVASLGLPRSAGNTLAEALYLGMRALADAFDTALVGGDTNSWDGPLVMSVTLFGEAPGGGPVTRGGANPGDWLLVTGSLGGSILGRHLDFIPRVREALVLHQQATPHAMIDISDGLAADVKHIFTESRTSAVLRAEAIPIRPAARQIED